MKHCRTYYKAIQRLYGENKQNVYGCRGVASSRMSKRGWASLSGKFNSI